MPEEKQETLEQQANEEPDDGTVVVTLTIDVGAAEPIEQLLVVDRSVVGGNEVAERIRLIASLGVWRTNPSVETLHKAYYPPVAVRSVKVRGNVDPLDLGIQIDNEGV
jgi:hypothetical protein